MERFYQLLRTRFQRPVDRAFDRAFWDKFEAEFQGRAKPVWFLAPAGYALTAVLLVSTLWTVQWRLEQTATTDLADIAPALEMQVALEHMDVFAEWESINLSEEEWQLLLVGS